MRGRELRVWGHENGAKKVVDCQLHVNFFCRRMHWSSFLDGLQSQLKEQTPGKRSGCRKAALRLESKMGNKLLARQVESELMHDAGPAEDAHRPGRINEHEIPAPEHHTFLILYYGRPANELKYHAVASKIIAPSMLLSPLNRGNIATCVERLETT